MKQFDKTNAVKIAVRERPICQNAGFDSGIVNSRKENVLIIGDRSFSFDYVLGPEVTQKKLYLEIAKPLVLKVFEGFYCTALAYGQTGTGKSYSMGLNNVNFLNENVGIIPRCLEEIFHLIGNDTVKVYISFIEIYNEKVFDILSKDSEASINTKGFKFSGGLKREVFNAEDGFHYLEQGMKNRHVRPTKMNIQSSRSHAIFTIHITKIMESQTVESCLNLVDLAGSEGVRRTGHAGLALAEGVNINQGLLSIGKVLQALSTGQKVIPYRDSILSSVLQDSLNKNSFLTLLACISPYGRDNSETLSTIRFAQNAKLLRNNPQIKLLSMEKQKNGPLRGVNLNTPSLTKKALNYNISNNSAIKRSFSNISYLTPINAKKTKSNAFLHSNSQTKQCPINKLRYNSRDNSNMPGEKSLQSSFPISNNCDNDTVNLRSSIISFDTSTSTNLDVSKASSFSPIIKKCLSAFELTMEAKMQKIFNNLESYNSNSIPNGLLNSGETLNTINKESISWDNIKSELQDIVRNEIITIKEQSEKTIEEIPTVIRQPVDNLLFNQISNDSLFKVPLLPRIDFINSSANRPFSDTDGNITVLQQTDKQHKPSSVRRSLRLSFIGKNNDFKNLHEGELRSPGNPRRSSLRLSIIRNEKENLKERNGKSTKLSSVRRSLRLSSIGRENDLKNLDEEKLHASDVPYNPLRRSLRLSIIPNENQNINNDNFCRDYRNKNEQNCRHRKTSKENKKKTKRDISHNDFINEYFTNDTNNLKGTKMEHEKAVFTLLNNGSINELKILPLIGLKTAYQIVTHRTLNGKFKSFNCISKLPVWKGTAWERFKKANNISQ